MPDGEWRSKTRAARGERGIWQRRYWEHLIRNERDLAHHIDYCWFNPVKHGLVANVVRRTPFGHARRGPSQDG